MTLAPVTRHRSSAFCTQMELGRGAVGDRMALFVQSWPGEARSRDLAAWLLGKAGTGWGRTLVAGKNHGCCRASSVPHVPAPCPAVSCPHLLFFSGRDRAEFPVAGAGASASPAKGEMWGCTTLPADVKGTIGEQEEDQPCAGEGERYVLGV